MFQLLSVVLTVMSVGHLSGNFWIVEDIEQIKIGSPIKMEVVIQDPEDIPITWNEMEIVHEKKVHVVVTNDQADYIQHIHPTPYNTSEATLVMNVTFPSPGWYYISYDFSPIKKTKLLASLIVFMFDINPVSGKLNSNESSSLCESIGICLTEMDVEFGSPEINSFLLQNPIMENDLWSRYQFEILHGGFSTRLYIPPPDGELQDSQYNLTHREPNLSKKSPVIQCDENSFIGDTCEVIRLDDEIKNKSIIYATLSSIEEPLQSNSCSIAKITLFSKEDENPLLLNPYLSAAAHVYILPDTLQEYPMFEHIHAVGFQPSSCQPMLPTNPVMTLGKNASFSHIYVPFNISDATVVGANFITVFIQARLDCNQTVEGVEAICEPGSRGVFTTTFDILLPGNEREREICTCPTGGWHPVTGGKCSKITNKQDRVKFPPVNDSCSKMQGAVLLSNPTAVQLSVAGSLLRSRTGAIGWRKYNNFGFTGAYSNNTELYWPQSGSFVSSTLLAPGYKFTPVQWTQCGFSGGTGAGKMIAGSCENSFFHMCELPCTNNVIVEHKTSIPEVRLQTVVPFLDIQTTVPDNTIFVIVPSPPPSAMVPEIWPVFIIISVVIVISIIIFLYRKYTNTFSSGYDIPNDEDGQELPQIEVTND